MSRGTGNRRNNPAKNRLALLERTYMRVFTELSSARFLWSGLPETCDARYMELNLFYNSLVIFYMDKDNDKHFCLKGSGQGQVDYHEDPTGYNVTSGPVRKQLKRKDCVPIWGNKLRIPDLDIATLYASKMAEVERTIEINLMAMRHPFILLCDDNEKLSLVNAMRQVQEGQPVIFGTSALGEMLDNKAKILDMRLDKDQVVNLQLVKTKQWNDCMTLLGINNANQDKRERLVSAEVSANDSQVGLARQIALQSRQQAVEEINKKYSLSIEVEWNAEIENLAAEKAGISDVGTDGN